jgi:hypothetical protein
MVVNIDSTICATVLTQTPVAIILLLSRDVYCRISDFLLFKIVTETGAGLGSAEDQPTAPK